MTFPMSPILDNIVVKPEAAEEKKGEIFIPTGAQERKNTGTVVAVGKGRICPHTCAILPFTVKVGDVVLYAAHTGTEVEVEGEKYLILKEEDLLLTPLRPSGEVNVQ